MQDTEPEEELQPMIVEPNITTLLPLPSALTYPNGIYQMIYKVCFLHPMHILSAFYYDMPLSGVLGLILFVTSLNYWKHPIRDSIERKMDVVCVHIIIPYQYYLSLFTTNTILSTGFMTAGILMYPLSNYMQTTNRIRWSALCHCLLHILISIGLCFMYKNYYAQGKDEYGFKLSPITL